MSSNIESEITKSKCVLVICAELFWGVVVISKMIKTTFFMDNFLWNDGKN